jgi:hypothetical protein
MADETRAPIRRKFYVVVRKSDQHILALCEEVVDAARAAIRLSRRSDVSIREAEVSLEVAFTGGRTSTA